jgi:hypothetical protein
MTRREIENSQRRVPNSEPRSEATDAIIGEIGSRDDELEEDEEADQDEDEQEFDEANEPSGDPAKNVPSA